MPTLPRPQSQNLRSTKHLARQPPLSNRCFYPMGGPHARIRLIDSGYCEGFPADATIIGRRPAPARSTPKSRRMKELRLESQEQALREAVLAGSESAWRALYDANFSSLYAFVFHRTGKDRHRTDDVVQETWLVAVRRIADFDARRGPFESWLKGIAANVLKNQRRRWQRDGRSQSLEGQQPAAPAGGGSPTGELLALALTALPERYQVVLRAKYEEQLSVAEIGRRLSHTSKAVESMLSRAREALRRAYQQLQNEQEGDR